VVHRLGVDRTVRDDQRGVEFIALERVDELDQVVRLEDSSSG
jgi:hypothetical protein